MKIDEIIDPKAIAQVDRMIEKLENANSLNDKLVVVDKLNALANLITSSPDIMRMADTGDVLKKKIIELVEIL